MTHDQTRRTFLRQAGAAAVALAGPAFARSPQAGPLFRISLAQWSLHRTIGAGELDHLDFARVARQEFGLEAIEYVNSFFKDRATDAVYLAEMNRRAAGEGVYQHLIMCDGEGRIGDPDPAARQQTIENHVRWLEAARTLGQPKAREVIHRDHLVLARELREQ